MVDVHTKLDWFKTIILPHQSALRARLRRLSGDPNDLDDLVAEVLARAYSNPNWQDVERGRQYLYTVARNLIIDLARRERIVSFETITEIELLQSGQDLESQLCARDQLRRLQGVLDQLPPQPRRAFILKRIYQKSLGEIAEEMELSVSTVEKHLGKAVRLFMGALAEQEDMGRERSERQDARGDRGTGRPVRHSAS
ncbi:MAG: sigma-70 family RNA polymerase sigma factor [Sphingobium sp.]|nr:sigma-70 family RNA polymerase sigma factor [Sphingobium sp.]